MGIENMPLQCMDCPKVTEFKSISEHMQEIADRSMSDFSFLDHSDDARIALYMSTKMDLLTVNETIQKSYHVMSEFWNQQARKNGCSGVNLILMECGIDF